MRMKAAALIVVLCLVAGVMAQQGSNPQNPPKAAKPKRPPKKKTYFQIIVLPVADATNMPADELRPLYARVGILNAFEKHIDVASPAMVKAYADEHTMDLSQPSNWTAATFDTIAPQLDAQYVATGSLVSLAVNQSGKIDKKKGPASITADVTITASVYDVRKKEFILDESSPGKEFHWKYTAKRGDEKLDQKSIGYEAIIEGFANAFKPVIGKIHK